MNKNQSAPLAVKIQDGMLVMSIGLETLVWASREENGGPVEALPDGSVCRIDGRKRRAFAHDVMLAMIKEDEVGNSPLNMFLDEMMEDAVENGSLASILKEAKARKAIK